MRINRLLKLVFFSDQEQPVYINTPESDLTQNNDAGLPVAVVAWKEPTVTDNSGFFTVTASHSSKSAFDIGITTVIYTAVDASGNIAPYAFNVTVVGMFVLLEHVILHVDNENIYTCILTTDFVVLTLVFHVFLTVFQITNLQYSRMRPLM